LNHVRDFRVGSVWIKDNTPPDAVVVCEQPQAIYLYAQRATVQLQDDPSALADIVTRQNPVYLLIAPKLEWRHDGNLEYSAATQEVLKALQTDVLQGNLVFEDQKAMVRVFRLRSGVDR